MEPKFSNAYKNRKLPYRQRSAYGLLFRGGGGQAYFHEDFASEFFWVGRERELFSEVGGIFRIIWYIRQLKTIIQCKIDIPL